MNLEHHLTPLVVYSGDPLLTALQKITANRSRVIFCVSAHGHLEGSLSDGDFRRWVARQDAVDLSRPCIEAANLDVASAPVGTAPADIAALFRRGVDRIPLLDQHGHLVAVAVDEPGVLRIGEALVGADAPTFVIAEIGNNHNGSLDLAKRLVDLSVEAGADCVKFQMRDMAALYRQGGGQSAGEDLGPQYTLDLLARMSLTNDELIAAFDHARAQGVEVMCTPWDQPSVDVLVDYGLPALKIASADLTNLALLEHASERGVPLVMSTGMSTEREIGESADLVRRTGTPFALLHCQSTYPAPFKDVNLLYLDRLAEIGQCPVGYSGHERGIHIPLAAVARGAKIIEKHVTVDRGMEGNDHTVSLLPDELATMVRQIRELEEAMGTAAPRDVSTGEMMNRVNLAKSLVATRDLAAGDQVTDADVTIKSPGRGLQPNSLARLLGRTLHRPVAAGDFFYPSDLTDTVSRGRQFSFRRPWGLPVRYHDYAALVTDCTPDFLEFHLSYKDMEMDLPKTFAAVREPLPMGFTVHLPDLFSGDFLVNLAEEDDAAWERSIDEVQRTIDTARTLRQWFTCEDDPVVIATLGGFTKHAHVTPEQRRPLYDRVARALARLDTTGVRFTAQTLPPYPWLMGGQQFHNLFMDPRDTVEFCEREGVRLTLDVSHTKLAATFLGLPFSQATALLAPLTDHLHIVDATGVDGEGVQVGDGEVDFALLAEQCDEWCPQAGFIPEIWQGHVNNGEGFWTALERLEQWF